MLVDVVLYGGEVDLLKARLETVKADKTIIVEGDKHFTGQHKGWSFLDNNVEHDIQKHIHRVHYLPVSSSAASNAWFNEKSQRDAVTPFLDALQLPDDAIVGFFDVDEFPNFDLMRNQQTVNSWLMAKYQMSLFWFEWEELTGVSGPWREMKKRSFHDWRLARNSVTPIREGFHFSSFGSVDEVTRKWLGFSHTEFRRENMREWVINCWENGRALQSSALLREESRLNDSFPAYMLNRRGPHHWYRKRPTF